MVSFLQGAAVLPVLKYVVDTNVWIEALTPLGYSSSEMRSASRSSVKRAYENGVIVMSKATARDISETVDKFARVGKISHDRKHLLNAKYKNVKILSPETFNEITLPPHRLRNHF